MKLIPTKSTFPIPLHIKQTLQKLQKEGFIAYLVGGSVRDFLLGIEAKDHDIATDANPDQVCALFNNAITVGKTFGVIKVPLYTEEKKPTIVEITTFRKDLEYQDHRHPIGVEFADPYEDAKRRDFTVNAFFYDHKSQKILDFVNGLDDLKNKTIRAIGNANTRFNEDSLRVIRAIRFSAHFQFQIEEHTNSAIQKCVKLLPLVSFERIAEEMFKILTSNHPSLGIQLLSQYKILDLILPELEKLKQNANAYQMTLKSIDLISKKFKSKKSKNLDLLAWAALLHEIPESARLVCDRMRLSRQKTAQIVTMIENQPKFKEVYQMREATLIRWLRDPYFESSLELHYILSLALNGNLAFYDFCKVKLEEIKNSHFFSPGQLITGEDLIELGLNPSPRFALILKTVEDLALEGKIVSKEQALEYVIQNFSV